MANKRRPSPTDDEMERIAEAILNMDKFNKIKDYDSFDTAYKDYFEDDNELKFRSDIEADVFNEIIKLDDSIDDTRARLIKKKKETSVRIQRGVEPYRLEISIEKDFKFVGREKGMVVYSRADSVTRRKKIVGIFRDKQGRFVSVKR